MSRRILTGAWILILLLLAHLPAFFGRAGAR